jgi:hypothetical protein
VYGGSTAGVLTRVLGVAVAYFAAFAAAMFALFAVIVLLS